MSRKFEATGAECGLARRLPLAAALALALTIAAPLTAAAAEAMTVVKDRETGELRAPTAVEAQALKAAAAQLNAAKGGAGVAARAAGPVETRYADGTVEMTLDDSTTMYSVATRNADGTVSTQCLPAKAAQKLVKAPKNSSAAKAAKAGHEHH